MIASKDKWKLQNPLATPKDKEAPEPTRQDRQPPRAASQPRHSWQPRFGLGTMMLVLLVCAMTAAAGRYLIQALAAGTSARAIFVIFVLIIPVVLLIVMNLIRLASSWLDSRRRRK